jgi:Domain of unknown function (DUF4157)
MTRASVPTLAVSPDAGRQATRRREPQGREPASPVAARVQALQRHAGNRALARGLWRAAPGGGRCACGGKAGPDGECAACRARRLALQRSAAGPARATAPPLVHRVIAAPGRPLDPGLRADMEERLSAHPVRRASGLLAAGEVSRPSDPPEREAERVAAAVVDGPAPAAGSRRVNLEGVRIHTGRQAAESARAVGAHAYTVGRHVVFGDGRFGPDSRSGRRLLAHELTHFLQQGEGVMRQACAHDGKGSANCGWYWRFDEAPEESSGVDARIVRLGLPSNLGGTWVSEVSTPENSLKRASKQQRGRVDGMKVIEKGSTLRLEIVEIKSRSTAQNGGCGLATREAAEYVRMLRQIAPRIAEISRAAANRGGIKPRDTPLAADRDALRKAGIDPKGADRAAWRFFNSLQDKLGRVFARGFDTVEFAPNQDGAPGTTYKTGGPTITLDCTTRRGKRTTGTIQLQFQVNTKGGVSYNCIKKCPDDDDERRRKEAEVRKPKEEEKEEGKRTRPGVDAPPPGERKQPPVRQPPRKQPPAEPPLQPSYIVEGVAAVAVLHRTAMITRDAVKRRALRKATDKLVSKMSKSAPELAKAIDGKAIEAFGTKAYSKTIIVEAQRYEARALKSGGKRLAGRLGKKVLSKTVLRALGPLAVVLTVKDALAMADHVAKGGEISFGVGAEASLEGSTKIEKKGKERAKGDLQVEAKLKDTKIDIDVSGLPKLSGGGEIDAKNVTIHSPGAISDGTPVTVNFRSKLKDTTITITHKGRIEGGGVVLESAVDISGSKIVIDLPPGAKQAKYEGGKPFVAKNADLRITKTSAKRPGEAPEPITGKHETTGEPGGAKKKPPSGTKGGGAGEGEDIPVKPVEEEEEAEEPPGAKPSDKYPKLGAETRKRIDASKPGRRVLEEILGTSPKGLKLDDKTIGRILDIVGGLDEKQVDKLVAGKKKITTETEKQFFAELEAAVAQVRKAPKGKPGAPGEPGKPGKTEKAEKAGMPARKGEKPKKPKKEEEAQDFYADLRPGDTDWVWYVKDKDPRPARAFGITKDGVRYHGDGTIVVLSDAPRRIKIIKHGALVDDDGKVRVPANKFAGKTLHGVR